jgi:hypothetical protein
MKGDSQNWSDLLDEVHELAHAVLAGRATPEQCRRLELLVAQSEDARRAYIQYLHETVVIRQYVRCNGDRPVARSFELPGDGLDQAQALADEREPSAQTAVGTSSEAPSVFTAEPPQTVARRRPARSWGRWSALALGLSGVVAAVLFAAFRDGGRNAANMADQRIARIARSADAVWKKEGEATRLQDGDWLSFGRYSLEQGIAQLAFPWGTEVTLEAPAEFEFAPDGTRQLLRGQLIAKVTQEDTGFTIDTPTVRVIDLGTEFGVSTAPSGESEVHVFRGAVEARRRGDGEAISPAPLTLGAGEATIFGAGGSSVHEVVFNPRRFSKAWRVASRVSETTGQMRFVHPPPESVVEGQTESNHSLLLFLEHEAALLSEATAVTLTQPGFYTTFNGRAAWFPAGWEVDSYMVHFDPAGSPGELAALTVKGSATFDRPILAVIARGDQLAAADSVLGSTEIEYLPGTKYEDPMQLGYLRNSDPPYYSRGLAGLFFPRQALRESAAPNDWLRISDDRRTLTLSCTSDGAAEQIRVLVAASNEELPQLAELPSPGPSQPYRARPSAVGEIIEAEDYDLGGDGVAYHDATPDLLANVYRTRESVELKSFVLEHGGGTVACFTRAGEWLAYTVEIAEAGTYAVKAHVASRVGGGQFRVEFGESAASRSMVVPKTETTPAPFPLDAFQTIESSPVVLDAGTHVMRVVMERNHADGWIGDFDWFTIERVGPVPGAVVQPKGARTP